MDAELRDALAQISGKFDSLGTRVDALATAVGSLHEEARATRKDAQAAREEARAAREEAQSAREETKSLARVVQTLAEQLRHLGALVEIIAKEQARIATACGQLSERFSEMMGVTVRARTGEAERYQRFEERLAALERAVAELRSPGR